MKKKGKNNNGITLIALVITIIVLLILAGISIATLTGQNGVLNKAVTAKDENKKVEYEEILKLIGNGLRPDKIMNGWNAKEYLDKFEEEIPKDERFKDAKVERRTDEMILVTTSKEKWVYLIRENEVKYLGTKDQIIAPDLQATDVTFTPSKGTWTNEDITVTISTEITGYKLEYSEDGKNWNPYTDPISVNQNKTIHARLNNEDGYYGGTASKQIDWIDKVEPSAEISDSAEETTITISLNNVSDESTDERYGSSGIEKIVYSINDEKTEPYETTNLTETSHSFTGLTAGTTYNVTVEIHDFAGNVTQLEIEPTTILIKWLVRNSAIIDKSFKLAGHEYLYFADNGTLTPISTKDCVFWEIPKHDPPYKKISGIFSNTGSSNGNRFAFSLFFSTVMPTSASGMTVASKTSVINYQDQSLGDHAAELSFDVTEGKNYIGIGTPGGSGHCLYINQLKLST